MLTTEEIKLVQDLSQEGMGIRAIARKMGRNVKAIRRALREIRDKTATSPPPAPVASPETSVPSAKAAPAKPPGVPPASGAPVSKLAPFEEAIRLRVNQGILVPRILREIREMGYSGARTILGAFVRRLHGPKQTSSGITRRFETKMAEEAQVDWSPFRVPIAGILKVVHCFSMILAYSRMMFIAFFRHERLPTLLFAHTEAFSFFGGLCRRYVYDNMSTVTVGRRAGGKPIWNAAFLDYARYYGFEPHAHRPRHSNRKGKVERPFPYILSDFLLGKAFDSWDDLNAQARSWLVNTANRRVHSTTHEVPEVRFAAERALLIQIPPVPFPAYEPLVRAVQLDGCVPVEGSFYPVPDARPGQRVNARLYPHRLEIVDGSGQITVAYPVPDRPTRILSDGQSFPPHGGAGMTLPAMEARFLARFPQDQAFLDGLKLRMKGLTHVHLRHIERLADAYSDGAAQAALTRATVYRNFSSLAIQRVLERAHPEVVPEIPPMPLSGNPALLGALDDIEAGSPEDYRYDSMPPTLVEHPADSRRAQIDGPSDLPAVAPREADSPSTADSKGGTPDAGQIETV